MTALTVGSLFSGIGGLDLGLERAGMEIRWNAENDAYCSQVLAKHWPNLANLGDVTRVEWEAVERVDLICGGFPCQPFSSAGYRRGLDDARWLWPEVARCVRVLRPRYVVVENVADLLADRDAFGTVLGDLYELGFNAEWSIVSACSVGAPHLRRRLFVVAYANGERRGWFSEPDRIPLEAFPEGVGGDDAYGSRLARERAWNQGRPGSLGMADGLPGWVDRRRVLGNAVVPQVAEWVGRRILEAVA